MFSEKYIFEGKKYIPKKYIETYLVLGIDNKEVVTQVIHTGLPVFVLAAQSLHERTAAESRRQDFHNGGKAIALVAAGFLTQTGIKLLVSRRAGAVYGKLSSAEVQIVWQTVLDLGAVVGVHRLDCGIGTAGYGIRYGTRTCAAAGCNHRYGHQGCKQKRR